MPKPSRVPLAAGSAASRSLATRAAVLETLMRSVRNLSQRALVAAHHANAVSALLIDGVGQVAGFSLLENRVSVVIDGTVLEVRLTALRPNAAAVVREAVNRQFEEVAA